jgi:hypothetical protein
MTRGVTLVLSITTVYVVACSRFSFANSGYRDSAPSIESEAQKGIMLKNGTVPIPTMNEVGRLLLILMTLGLGLLLLDRGYLRQRE